PGPGHYIAEREVPMKIAMSVLAFGAVVAGILQIPGVDSGISRFLEPTFADSILAKHDPSTAADWVGLLIGAAIAIAGIATAYRIWVLRPGTAPALEKRFSAVHTFLWHKWYFDELIDLLIVRPALWFGRVCNSIVEP